MVLGQLPPNPNPNPNRGQFSSVIVHTLEKIYIKCWPQIQGLTVAKQVA